MVLAVLSASTYANGDTGAETDADALAERALRTEPSEALIHVRTLERRASIDASHALLRIARHGPRAARPGALLALGRVGIRTRKSVGYLRDRAKNSLDAAERAAALEALGFMASMEEDAETLIAALDSDVGCLRTGAYRGIRHLSGQRLPASPRRIEAWWRSFRNRGRRQLEASLDSIQQLADEGLSADDPAWGRQRARLRQYGWIDLTLVSERIESWLRSPHASLEAEALGTISALRLGDFERVLRGRAGGRNPPASLVQALETLGIVP